MDILHKEWKHPNLTIAKATKFGLGYLIVYPLSLGLLWLLTEKVGVWYMYSSLISGCVAGGLRFLVGALVVFKKEVG